MNRTNQIVLAIVVLIVIAGGVALANRNTGTKTSNPQPSPSPNSSQNSSSTKGSSSSTNSSSTDITISTNDSSASQTTITVSKGTKVNLTFKVDSDGVYHGGLQFKSTDPALDSGPIKPGESKTVSFVADKSFEFTPYWYASGVKKDYMISIVVQ